MATGNVVFRDSRVKKYLLALLLLLLVLLLLLFSYYLLTRPAQLAGEEGVPDNENFRFLHSIYGFEGDLLNRPSDATIGPDGRIYVADTMKHRVVIFEMDGRYVGNINGLTGENYGFVYPVSVAVAEDGRIFVLSKQERAIIVFDQNFEPLDIVVFPDLIPTDVSVYGDRLYVATDKAIMVGTLEGAPVQQIGMFGKAEGRFDLPGGLVIDQESGIMYVADSLNYRVQAIDPETGAPEWVYGEPIPPGEAIKFRGPSRVFGLPASIALDEMGKLYVVDGTNSEIVILDTREGRYVDTVGEVGHEDGRFYYPDGISYGAGGYIAVADKFNDRVMVFRVPTPDVAPVATRWLPLLLLPLLALLLWLLAKRRTRYVATPDFITTVIEREFLDDVADYAKKLHVTPATYALFQDAFEKPELVETEPDEGKLDEIHEKTDLAAALEGALADTLTVVYQLKGKKVLLAEVEPIRQAADELEIANASLEDLLEQGDVAERPMAESEGE